MAPFGSESTTDDDLDGDSDLDLVTGGNDGKIRVFRNNGDGTFTQQTAMRSWMPFTATAVSSRSSSSSVKRFRPRIGLVRPTR